MEKSIKFELTFVLLGCFGLLCCCIYDTAFAGEGDAAQEWVDVEVLVNVLEGADANNIDDAIAKANEALAQAHIRLVKKATDPNASADEDGSGALDRDERDQAREDGQEELNNTCGAGKGVKIDVTDDCEEGEPNTVGLAIHRNPVIIIEPDTDTNELGKTIAHEFGHVFTLDYDKYDANDINDLMYGYTGSGTHLDANEVNEIFGEAKRRGRAYFVMPRVLSGRSVAIPAGINYSIDGFGATLDEFKDTIISDPLGVLTDPNDPTTRYADIGEVIVFADSPFEPASKITTTIQSSGLYPESIWSVDSFFDITYSIDYEGTIGSAHVAMLNGKIYEAIWYDPYGFPTEIPIEAVLHTESEFKGMPHVGEPHNYTLEVSIPIELVQLSLTSAEPITVEVDSMHLDHRNSSDPLNPDPDLDIMLMDFTEPFDFALDQPCPCPGLTFAGGSDKTCSDELCYDWTLSGCGFTPGKDVEVQVNGETVTTARVHENGGVFTSFYGISAEDGLEHEVLVKEIDDDLSTGGAKWATGYFIVTKHGELAGDIDKDGDVDFYDFAYIANDWLVGTDSP